MITSNAELRRFLKDKNIKHWQLGVLLGVSESTVYRLMRNELSAETKDNIIRVINAHLESKGKE